jgi:hypothetical protein
MYVGLFSFIIDGLGATTQYAVVTLLYILSSLPLVLTSALAYAMGFKNVHLLGGKKAKK